MNHSSFASICTMYIWYKRLFLQCFLFGPKKDLQGCPEQFMFSQIYRVQKVTQPILRFDKLLNFIYSIKIVFYFSVKFLKKCFTQYPPPPTSQVTVMTRQKYLYTAKINLRTNMFDPVFHGLRPKHGHALHRVVDTQLYNYISFWAAKVNRESHAFQVLLQWPSNLRRTSSCRSR